MLRDSTLSLQLQPLFHSEEEEELGIPNADIELWLMFVVLLCDPVSAGEWRLRGDADLL